MKPFHPLQTEIGKPEQFNNPFCYEPHPLCVMAAEEVHRYITENAEIKEDADKGKMFGVLVVEAPHRKRDQTVGFLAAYSGLLAGKNSWSWFVPPVYNAQKRFGYFKRNESRLTKMNREVDALEKRLYNLLNSADYLKMQQTVENLLSEHERKMKTAKALRDMKRLQKNISPEEHAELVRESQFMKAEMRRIKKRCEEMARPWKEKKQSLREKIEQLKNLRKESSDELQRWLFSQYKMRNAEGEQKDILDIFADYSGQLPPAGAGDCCAPKLLQYAFEHHLKPLCMAEFWWGESPKMEIRHHLHYYPACRGKCLPILTWMLGTDFSGKECGVMSEISILHEDDYLIVLNKPAGMLSVPGKTGEESVESIIRERLHDEVNPLIVHRLDMDTSGLMVVAIVRGCDLFVATRNFTTSYISLAPMMVFTGISLPAASIMTALAAPLKGAKLLTASPSVPTKKPLVLPISVPSAPKVFTVKTDFVAFFTQLGCAYIGKKVRREKSKTPITRFCTLLKYSVLISILFTFLLFYLK